MRLLPIQTADLDRRSPPIQTTGERRSPAIPSASAAGIVHVAVGRSTAKTITLLQWTFRQFGCKEVGLVHVHQHSPTIPTLLGGLPANQANEELVAAYRKVERMETERILQGYQNICHRAQVQPKIVVTESGHVREGIVDLITTYGIRKLVMGATSNNCFKVKGRYSKVTYIAHNTPKFCEIWFVSKGKHVWTRDASEGIDEYVGLDPSTTTQMQGDRSSNICESDNAVAAVSTTIGGASCCNQTTSQSPACMINKASWLTLASERNSSAICSKEELEIEGFYNRLQEVCAEIETSKKEAFNELAKRNELESNIADAMNRVKALEAASEMESKTRKQLQEILITFKMQHKELLSEKEEALRELQNAKTSIALLDDHAKELTCRREEAARDLELIQSSIGTLLLERQKTQEQRNKPIHLSVRWRCSGYSRSPNCNKLLGFASSVTLTEFSAVELQTATCDFSESFNLGQVGDECVYKGEILNRTVVIKKLHLHNVHGQKEFQQEVYALGKHRHPHLVSLLGICPELLSLVYEYLPNGTLHHHLFCRTTTHPLTWMVRSRIVAEIASALLFLHSSKPERIIHGNLKPESIFLDSNLNCKIGDLGICRFVPEDTRNCPLFHRHMEPRGAFPYADPEYQRTGVLTAKSDVYSFGIIILQLLTRRQPWGLASVVRRAVLSGTLSLILDSTAGDWPSDVATKLAEFGLRCSEMNSRDRPDMTPETVRELKQLHLMKERPVPSFFLCPILQEIMHDPQAAADGFTYEGSALRDWLENGRGTSPMTNLKLDHRSLTPNHALRFAIHDWLCQPCQP